MLHNYKSMMLRHPKTVTGLAALPACMDEKKGGRYVASLIMLRDWGGGTCTPGTPYLF